MAGMEPQRRTANVWTGLFDRLVARWPSALSARRALGAEPVEAFVAGPGRRLDVATVGERLFLNNASIGYPLTGLGGRPRLDAGMLEVSALRRTEGQELGRVGEREFGPERDERGRPLTPRRPRRPDEPGAGSRPGERP
jgi:hypothetical protein